MGDAQKRSRYRNLAGWHNTVQTPQSSGRRSELCGEAIEVNSVGSPDSHRERIPGEVFLECGNALGRREVHLERALGNRYHAQCHADHARYDDELQH